jgi:hypothetical protein
MFGNSAQSVPSAGAQKSVEGGSVCARPTPSGASYPRLCFAAHPWSLTLLASALLNFRESVPGLEKGVWLIL